MAGKEEEGGTASKPRRKRRRGPTRQGGPTNEPESTVHLLRARTAYFKDPASEAASPLWRQKTLTLSKEEALLCPLLEEWPLTLEMLCKRSAECPKKKPCNGY